MSPGAPRPELLPWPRAAEDGTPLGVDLVKLHLDVRRIVLAHFHPAGVDREDLVATVLAAIARKNRQPSAFEPRRASFSKYVFTVARSQTANLLQAERRHTRLLADDADPENVAEVAAEEDPIEAFETCDALRDAPEQLWQRALRLRQAEQAAERAWSEDPHRPAVQTRWTW